MPWKELAVPNVPVTMLSVAKADARVTTSSEDQLIKLKIEAAVRAVEAETRRAILSRQFLLVLDQFPCDSDEIDIPIGGLSAVNSVKYVAEDGTLTTWDSSNYSVDAVSPLGRIKRALGVPWPVTKSSTVNTVQVTFTAGYGTTEESIPAPLRQAILYLTTHQYDVRSPVNIGNIVTEIPKTLDYALDPYRIHKP